MISALDIGHLVAIAAVIDSIRPDHSNIVAYRLVTIMTADHTSCIKEAGGPAEQIRNAELLAAGDSCSCYWQARVDAAG